MIADIGLADQPELVDSVIEANFLQGSISLNAMQQSLGTEQTVNRGNDVQPSNAGGQCDCCKSKHGTKADKKAANKAMKSAYTGFFYANNFAYLNDLCYDGSKFCGEPLKNRETISEAFVLAARHAFVITMNATSADRMD